MASAKKLVLLRRTIWRAFRPPLPSFSATRRSYLSSSSLSSMYNYVLEPSSYRSKSFLINPSSSFCSQTPPLNEGCQGPTTVDYRLLLTEDEYHRLANSTIHDLLEKLEEYGDLVDIDGFDVDYGNEVLTLKLGSLGTYVINKQTPNRQIWMSSPVSGPSRFDWDQNSEAWIYRRTKAKLNQVLETELGNLCGMPIKLS
nr:frataxin, mitochondrial-like [Ipomoea trifida]